MMKTTVKIDKIATSADNNYIHLTSGSIVTNTGYINLLKTTLRKIKGCINYVYFDYREGRVTVTAAGEMANGVFIGAVEVGSDGCVISYPEYRSYFDEISKENIKDDLLEVLPSLRHLDNKIEYVDGKLYYVQLEGMLCIGIGNRTYKVLCSGSNESNRSVRYRGYFDDEKPPINIYKGDMFISVGQIFGKIVKTGTILLANRDGASSFEDFNEVLNVSNVKKDFESMINRLDLAPLMPWAFDEKIEDLKLRLENTPMPIAPITPIL